MKQKNAGEIFARPLTNVRAGLTQDHSNIVILEIRAGPDLRHYSMSLSDLRDMSRHLAASAILLSGQVGGRA